MTNYHYEMTAAVLSNPVKALLLSDRIIRHAKLFGTSDKQLSVLEYQLKKAVKKGEAIKIHASEA